MCKSKSNPKGTIGRTALLGASWLALAASSSFAATTVEPGTSAVIDEADSHSCSAGSTVCEYEDASREISIASVVSFGAGGIGNVVSTIQVDHDVTIGGEGDGVLAATFSVPISWSGIFFGIDAGGSSARAIFNVNIIDDTIGATLASRQIQLKDFSASAGLPVPGVADLVPFDVGYSADVLDGVADVMALVHKGHDYRIQVEAICKSSTTGAGGAFTCAYSNNVDLAFEIEFDLGFGTITETIDLGPLVVGLIGDRKIVIGDILVTVANDQGARLIDLTDQVEQLGADLEVVSDQVGTVDTLVRKPQGQRKNVPQAPALP